MNQMLIGAMEMSILTIKPILFYFINIEMMIYKHFSFCQLSTELFQL